jgi:hypothetical protein
MLFLVKLYRCLTRLNFFFLKVTVALFFVEEKNGSSRMGGDGSPKMREKS